MLCADIVASGVVRVVGLSLVDRRVLASGSLLVGGFMVAVDERGEFCGFCDFFVVLEGF